MAREQKKVIRRTNTNGYRYVEVVSVTLKLGQHRIELSPEEAKDTMRSIAGVIGWTVRQNQEPRAGQ